MLLKVAAAAMMLLAGSALGEPQKAAPPCPKVDFTAADVPATCKSRDDKVVCGANGCIDQIVDKIAPQLPTDYPCSMSSDYLSNCLGPFIGPMASSGANLQALMKCDSAASMERIRAKGVIKCKADATATAATPAPAPAKA